MTIGTFKYIYKATKAVTRFLFCLFLSGDLPKRFNLDMILNSSDPSIIIFNTWTLKEMENTMVRNKKNHTTDQTGTIRNI